MVKRILLTLLIFSSATLYSQVSVTLKAPAQAEEGQRINVSYTVNTQDVDDFSVGDFTGFDVLMGPSQSRSSSYSMINGKTTSSSTITYTYVLAPQKKGTFKLPSATVKSGGKEYRSNTASVEVLPNTGGNNNNTTTQGAQQQATRMRTQNAGDNISAKDLYVTATASKHKVYEQEAILLTYKLYTLVTIDQADAKMPDLDGFLIQEIDLPQQKSLKMEHVNGKNYGTVVWKQYVLFPQQTGKLRIPAINFDCEVVQQNRSVDPFAAFFGGGGSLVRVQKTVVAPAVEFEVSALPTKPSNFSGAVGTDFRLAASLTPEQVDANDAVQLRLTLSGTGNMKLIRTPDVAWPKDFETYDPKVNEKTKLTSAGNTGNITYDYTAVPRHGGKYAIAPIELCYFDTKTHTYKTVTTDSLHLAVAKTVGAISHAKQAPNQEDVKVLADDIRFIRIGTAGLHRHANAFFGTLAYWLAHLALVIIAALATLLIVRRRKANGNTARKRGRKANKVAARRLKTAKRLLAKGNATAFYDEVTRALWGYVGDKLNLPASELTKDNVSLALEGRNVTTEQATAFLRVLDDCEFARFAPGDPQANMDKVFAEATNVIDTLDAQL